MTGFKTDDLGDIRSGAASLSSSPPILRVKFATGSVGCLAIGMLVLIPFAFWMIAFADLSDSHARGADFLRMLQSWKIAGVPVAAFLLAGYFSYEAFLWSWRWIDEIAVGLTDHALLVHPSIWKRPIALNNLRSVEPTHRNGGRLRTNNPALLISWYDDASSELRSRRVDNVQLDSAEGNTFRERLIALGKWSDES